MRRTIIATVLGVGILVSAGLAAALGSLGEAVNVPGLSGLGTGSNEQVAVVSCGADGTCSAAGTYDTGSRTNAFVTDLVSGTWQDAIDVPGLATLDVGREIRLGSISCVTSGACSLVGSYGLGGLHELSGFVADRVGGVWQSAEPVPGLAALDVDKGADPVSVSCAGDGECSMVGTYRDGNSKGFVADRVGGVWQNAVPIPGLASMQQGNAYVESVSCPAIGECVMVGRYETTTPPVGARGFSARRIGGVWQTATDLPGLAALATGGGVENLKVSCPVVGSCAAIGGYYDGVTWQAFVIDMTSGTWGSAITVPGYIALSGNQGGSVAGISGASPGNCSMIGSYNDSARGIVGYVADEVGGVWGDAIDLPGLVAHATGTVVPIAVGCAAPGVCSIVGFVSIAGGTEGFLSQRTSGTWGTGGTVPGLAALDSGKSGWPQALSCVRDRNCAAGGYASNGSGTQGFVTQWVPTPTAPPEPVPPRFTG